MEHGRSTSMGCCSSSSLLITYMYHSPQVSTSLILLRQTIDLTQRETDERAAILRALHLALPKECPLRGELRTVKVLHTPFTRSQTHTHTILQSCTCCEDYGPPSVGSSGTFTVTLCRVRSVRRCLWLSSLLCLRGLLLCLNCRLCIRRLCWHSRPAQPPGTAAG